MGAGFTFCASAAVSPRARIRWDVLGCPTHPCTREYKGELVEVRQKDIDAANGNPNAVFTLSRFRLWGGPSYYRLGAVEVPPPTLDVQSKLRAYDEGPRQLLIKWKDLGSPSTPDRVQFRGTVVEVRERNIIAARGNPDAVFTATKICPHASRPYYVLGNVDLESCASSELEVA